MRDVYADCTTNFGLVGTASPNLFSNHFSLGGDSMSRSSSRNEDKDREKSVCSEANMLHFDDELISEVWETFKPQLILALRTFFQSLNLETEFTTELETFLQDSFFSVFVAGIQELKCFDWKRWWDKRDFMLTAMDGSSIRSMVAEAEEMIYAPVFSIDASAAVVADKKDERTGEPDNDQQSFEGEEIQYGENNRISDTESLIELVNAASLRVDWQALRNVLQK